MSEGSPHSPNSSYSRFQGQDASPIVNYIRQVRKSMEEVALAGVRLLETEEVQKMKDSQTHSTIIRKTPTVPSHLVSVRSSRPETSSPQPLDWEPSEASASPSDTISDHPWHFDGAQGVSSLTTPTIDPNDTFYEVETEERTPEESTQPSSLLHLDLSSPWSLQTVKTDDISHSSTSLSPSASKSSSSLSLPSGHLSGVHLNPTNHLTVPPLSSSPLSLSSTPMSDHFHTRQNPRQVEVERLHKFPERKVQPTAMRSGRGLSYPAPPPPLTDPFLFYYHSQAASLPMISPFKTGTQFDTTGLGLSHSQDTMGITAVLPILRSVSEKGCQTAPVHPLSTHIRPPELSPTTDPTPRFGPIQPPSEPFGFPEAWTWSPVSRTCDKTSKSSSEVSFPAPLRSFVLHQSSGNGQSECVDSTDIFMPHEWVDLIREKENEIHRITHDPRLPTKPIPEQAPSRCQHAQISTSQLPGIMDTSEKRSKDETGDTCEARWLPRPARVFLGTHRFSDGKKRRLYYDESYTRINAYSNH